MNERTQLKCRLDVLGGFNLTTTAGDPVIVSSRKAQVLIAYLAHRSGQPVPRAKLASMFWSDTSESEARHSLRQCLLVLRQTLSGIPSLLEIGPEAVRLRRESVASDAMEFEALLGVGTEEALARATALYRGEFLEGIRLVGEPIDEWIVFERRRIAHLMKRSLTTIFDASQSAGRVDDAITAASRLLAIDPQQEDVRKTLATLYGDPGRKMRSALVATTDSAARRVASEALANAGFDVRTCLDGADVLLEIGSNEPHAVLIDAGIPLFDATDVVRALAAKVPHLPVICFGEPGEEVESTMLSLGAADFVAKPLDPEVLLLRVDRALTRDGGRSSEAC
ncbi:MAG TPA: response regulator [Thermoanaerobaculia bacterium]|nr:response regulator [Thermoanaerobaculia bacterium]